MNHRRCAQTFFPLLLGIQIASAQLDQAAAIREFAIPKFDQEGRRAWILSGQELRRHSEEEATVVEMD